LWSWLVQQNRDNVKLPSKILKAEAIDLQLCTEEEWEDFCQQPVESNLLMNLTHIHNILVSIARRRLPPTCGNRIANLVVYCLEVLSGGFVEDIFQNEHVEVGLNLGSAVKESFNPLTSSTNCI
jgi:hypothetical protein